MRTVTSKDGTTIAFDMLGKGPTIILVGGAFEYRHMDSNTARLAAYPLMNQYFTVIHYDRRGRGDSTDTQPYAVEREIEDIEALIDESGGTAFLSGSSSGAALAMRATIALPGKVKGLAMYEPPYREDAKGRQSHREFRKQLNDLLAQGRRKDAVGSFMMLMGLPADRLDSMHQDPVWSKLEAIVPSLAYDLEILGEDASVPASQAARVEVPTIVMNGELGGPFMLTTAKALASAIPGAQHRILEGQTHEVAPDALAPVLLKFFLPGG